MQDGRTSYFHQSIGGYHAAKMRRYQELFDYQIAKNNMETLKMLNTKYVIFTNKHREEELIELDANGNAWFVNEFKTVTSANEEIRALDSLDTKNKVVISKNDFEKFQLQDILSEQDSTATIQLTKYDVTTLEYLSKTRKNQFAVFSEIYYKNGWNAYVDGKLTPHFRVNYVLRGMLIPKGTHTIIFKFEPTVIKKGNIIGLFSYGLLLLISVGWFFLKKKKLS